MVERGVIGKSRPTASLLYYMQGVAQYLVTFRLLFANSCGLVIKKGNTGSFDSFFVEPSRLICFGLVLPHDPGVAAPGLQAASVSVSSE